MPLIPMDPAVASGLRAAPLTYPEAGATTGVLPEGYHHVRRGALIGKGAQAFAGAVQALMGWQVHVRAGLRVSPSAPVAAAEVVVLMGIGIGPVRLAAPCRVVYVVDGPGRRGVRVRHSARASRARRGGLHRQHDRGWHGDVRGHRVLQARYLAREGDRATRPRRPVSHHDPLPAGAGRAVER